MDIKIFVAYHKDSVIIKNEVFEPIHVGKELASKDLGLPGDNSGDNISSKNPIYCEMTAVYWAWKNVESDYVGLCHYRRIFTFATNPIYKKLGRMYKYITSKIINIFYPGNNFLYTEQIRVHSLEEYISMSNQFSYRLQKELQAKDYDVIVPKPIKLSNICVYQFFEVGLEHMLLMDEIIKEINPDFYRYYKKSLGTNILFAANIFIMKSELFNDYCNTIFPILKEHERRTVDNGWCIDIIKEKCYSRRSGYFSEFLTNAYILKLIEEKHSVLYANTAFLCQ